MGAACQRPSAPPAAAPQAAASPSPAQIELNAREVELYLAVRNRALQRLEDAVSEVEVRGGDLVSKVEELSEAERQAAAGLGVDWPTYVAVRDEVARVLSLQRQREDVHLLALELSHTRQDLAAQLREARDAASRQFLEAQLKNLDSQLERLAVERAPTVAEQAEERVVQAVRADLATLQGRQDRLQRRIRDLLDRKGDQARSSTVPGP